MLLKDSTEEKKTEKRSKDRETICSIWHELQERKVHAKQRQIIACIGIQVERLITKNEVYNKAWLEQI